MSDLPGLAHVVGDPVERLLRGSALLLAEEEVWGELLDHVQVDGPRDCVLLHRRDSTSLIPPTPEMIWPILAAFVEV